MKQKYTAHFLQSNFISKVVLKIQIYSKNCGTGIKKANGWNQTLQLRADYNKQNKPTSGAQGENQITCAGQRSRRRILL